MALNEEQSLLLRTGITVVIALMTLASLVSLIMYRHSPYAFGFTAVTVFIAAMWGFAGYRRHIRQTEQQQLRISELEKRAIQEPERASYAWDLARVKLEAYFDRNLDQVRAIFWVAALVMVVGFVFIGWGIYEALTRPDQIKVATIGAASGVITQFFGATFMVIYRSTMLQATQFVTVLERINSVGMAVQILDAMDEKSSELKDVTRVDIIRLLLAPASAELSFSPRSRKKKVADAPDKGEAAHA